MPLPEVASGNKRRGARIELEKPEEVGDRGPLKTNPLGGLLMGEREFADQPIDPLGTLERIQVLSLEVLDQGPLGRLAVVESLDDRWNLLQTQDIGGTEAPLSGDQLEASSHRANHDRLHETIGSNRLDQGLHRRFVETLPGLVGVPSHLGRMKEHQPFGVTLTRNFCHWR